MAGLFIEAGATERNFMVQTVFLRGQFFRSETMPSGPEWLKEALFSSILLFTPGITEYGLRLRIRYTGWMLHVEAVEEAVHHISTQIELQRQQIRGL
jgi:hypothetical protein